MTLEITLPFDQKAVISVKGEEFNRLQQLFIGKVRSFAAEGIRVLKETEQNWAAKFSNMTNQEFAVYRAKLIQRDCAKLKKLGCKVEFVKI